MSAESAQTMPERSELVTAEHRLNEVGITLPAPVSVVLRSLIEEVSAIAGPLSDWSAKYREHHPTV